MRKKTPPVEKKLHLQFSKVATSKVKTAIVTKCEDNNEAGLLSEEKGYGKKGPWSRNFDSRRYIILGILAW